MEHLSHGERSSRGKAATGGGERPDRGDRNPSPGRLSPSRPLPPGEVGARSDAGAAPSRLKPRHDVGNRQELALARGAALELDLALGEALRADEDLPRRADEVGGCELRARAPVAGVEGEGGDRAL